MFSFAESGLYPRSCCTCFYLASLSSRFGLSSNVAELRRGRFCLAIDTNDKLSALHFDSRDSRLSDQER